MQALGRFPRAPLDHDEGEKMQAMIASFAGVLFVSGAAFAAAQPWAVLPGASVAQMLQQCSRGAPSPGEATWQPTAQDVAALENAMPAAMPKTGRYNVKTNKQSPPRIDPATVLDRFRRQYVGIVRGGRRFIYGNFSPGHAGHIDRDWRMKPEIICDGGANFFGVEYDVAAGIFTRIDFNGPG